jgi:hypothetical protein
MLLLASLLGLAAMHNLGHHGLHLAAGHHPNHPVAMVRQPVAEAVDIAVRATDGCDDGCGAVLTAPTSGGDGVDGWDVCLAALVGFAVPLLAAVLLQARWAAATVHPGGRFVLRHPRGPPSGRVALTLATASVLRT